MTYIKLTISIDEEYRELLIAGLSEMEFDAFEEREADLITYIPKERFSDVYREQIEQLLSALPGDGFIRSEEVVADRNWNEEWERTIRAQEVGLFFIKPTWDRADVPDGKVLLEIDPKMAFGTGYHETTRLMLELLPGVARRGDRVLDIGTGTGILAIAAVKLGIGEALALDIDEWSVRNAEENTLINGVADRITVQSGSVLDVAERESFDLVLANINRTTIIDLLPGLSSRVKNGGTLLLSGLLYSDRELILKQETLKAYELTAERSENEWIALQFNKREE